MATWPLEVGPRHWGQSLDWPLNVPNAMAMAVVQYVIMFWNKLIFMLSRGAKTRRWYKPVQCFPLALYDCQGGSSLFGTGWKMRPRRSHPRKPIGQAMLLMLSLGMAQVALAEQGTFRSGEYPTFAHWRAACAKLPSNRVLLGQAATSKLEPALPAFEEVAKALRAAVE